MIQKAYIEKQIDGFSYKVRIPRYNKSSAAPSKTPTEQLYTAYVCQQPNVNPYYSNGDVVFVCFENDDTSQPIIIGKLFNSEESQSHSEISSENILESTSPITTIDATTLIDLSSYAKTSDLDKYAKTTDLDNYAKSTDLNDYVKTIKVNDAKIVYTKGDNSTVKADMKLKDYFTQDNLSTL